MMIGDIVEIKFDSIEVVLSVPKKRRPKETVESKKPLIRIIPMVLGFLGIFILTKKKIITAITVEMKNL